MTWHEAYLELRQWADDGMAPDDRAGMLRTLIDIRDLPER